MIARVKRLLAERERVIVGIDGHSCAGKSTLAAQIARMYDGNVVHMDDFYLPAGMRTDEPGGNIDTGRIAREVLEPLLASGRVAYRVFDCARQCLADEIELAPKKLTIIEGSYSLLPALARFYDLTAFVRIGADEQRRRVLAREGERADDFFKLWIPRENKYFAALDIEKNCDIVIG